MSTSMCTRMIIIPSSEYRIEYRSILYTDIKVNCRHHNYIIASEHRTRAGFRPKEAEMKHQDISWKCRTRTFLRT